MNPSSMYNTTAYVRARTYSTDGIGGQTATSQDSASVSCRIRQLSAREQTTLGETGQLYTHRLYCAGTVTLTEGDQVISGGITYEVGSIYNLGEHQEADLWRANRG